MRRFPWCRAIRIYRVIKVLGILPELRTRVNLSLPEQVFLHECKGYKRLNNLSIPPSLALDGKGARIPAEFQMRSLPTAKEKMSRETEALAERYQK